MERRCQCRCTMKASSEDIYGCFEHPQTFHCLTLAQKRTMLFQNATSATKNRIICLAKIVAYEFVPLAIMMAFVAIVRTIAVDPAGYRRQFPDGLIKLTQSLHPGQAELCRPSSAGRAAGRRALQAELCLVPTRRNASARPAAAERALQAAVPTRRNASARTASAGRALQAELCRPARGRRHHLRNRRAVENL